MVKYIVGHVQYNFFFEWQWTIGIEMSPIYHYGSKILDFRHPAMILIKRRKKNINMKFTLS